MRKISSLILVILILASTGKSQTAEVTVNLNEQFFDALHDAIFKNFNPPEFPLAANNEKSKIQNSKSSVLSFDNANSAIRHPKPVIENCN